MPSLPPALSAKTACSRGEQFRAHMVNYSDDFVILSRGKAREALEWTRGVLERLELTLNEKKTSIRTRPAKSEVARLARILPMREHGEIVSNSRRVCL